LAVLTERHDPRSVVWRFDPICHYRLGGETVLRDNLVDFVRIARAAADCGIRRCITSFMDDYAKIRRRTAALKGFTFVDPPLETKHALLFRMESVLRPLGIALFTCCEKEVVETLPSDSAIRSSSCIPSELLMALFGGRLFLGRDPGQRIAQGCGCRPSVDIGSYTLHPCYHDCLFCYANPSAPVRADNGSP
jgi:hypothetical protein